MGKNKLSLVLEKVEKGDIKVLDPILKSTGVISNFTCFPQLYAFLTRPDRVLYILTWAGRKRLLLYQRKPIRAVRFLFCRYEDDKIIIQWYTKALGIKLHWAKRAQTKGKIERFWRFVQGDFVHEVWNAKSIHEVNGKFRVWLAQYNWKFKSRYFGGITRASRYKLSEREASKIELQTLLVVEERRKEVCS